MERWLRAVVCATSLAVAAAGGLSPAAGAERPLLEEDVLKAFEALEGGALAPGDVARDCTVSVDAAPEADTLRQAMTGFLEVPPQRAVAALCAALVRAVVAETFTASDMRLIAGAGGDTEAREVGRLLRAIYFAHRQAAPRSAEARW